MFKKRLKTIVFFLLIVLLFSFGLAFYQQSKYRNKRKSMLLSSNQAVGLALSLDQVKALSEPETVSIENTMQINSQGLGDNWLVYLISRPDNLELRIKILQGVPEIIFQTEPISKDYPSLPEKIISSEKAIETVLNNGFPADNSYSFYLGRFSDLEKYGQAVVSVHTVIQSGATTKVSGLILDPQTGEILRKIN
jgi:hypothetical protein